MIRLPDEHEHAFLGVTICEDPRFAYSLPALARKMENRTRRTTEQCRMAVARMVFEIRKEHGDHAPVFIDDTVFRNGTIARPQIITP